MFLMGEEMENSSLDWEAKSVRISLFLGRWDYVSEVTEVLFSDLDVCFVAQLH